MCLTYAVANKFLQSSKENYLDKRIWPERKEIAIPIVLYISVFESWTRMGFASSAGAAVNRTMWQRAVKSFMVQGYGIE